MKQNISIFFVSFLYLSQSLFAQDIQLLGAEKGGIRFGYDLSRLGIQLFESDRLAWEVSFDAQLNQRLLLAGEFGSQNVNSRKIANYVYSSNGKYLTIGVDKIFFDLNTPDDLDIIFGGLRYGVSFMNQSSEFLIKNNYFGQTTGKESNKVSVHWLEAIFGTKVQVFTNFFIGISTRVQFGVYLPKEKQLPNYIHAGFGNSDNRLNVGINYNILYRFPLYKLKQFSK